MCNSFSNLFLNTSKDPKPNQFANKAYHFMIRNIILLFFTILFTLGATFQNTLDELFKVDFTFEKEQIELLETNDTNEKLSEGNWLKIQLTSFFYISHLKALFVINTIGNTSNLSFIPYIPPELN